MQQQDTENNTSTLAVLLAFADRINLCGELEETELQKLGRDLVFFTQLDDDSRDDWLKKSETAMKLALQVVEEKTSPWKNASNVKYPLITVAAIQFHARAYPAIVSGDKVVKGKVTGNDADGAKQQQALRIASHMNWQLLEENEDWEEDTDKLLLALPIEGVEFKKSYFSSERGYNISEWVKPKDFIVHSKTKSLLTCPRKTHRIYYYPHEIDEKWRKGLWREEDLQISKDDLDEEVLQEFFEQHCYIDLDQDGYKEPYIVTAHVKSEKVVRIVSGYYPEDIEVGIRGVTSTLGELGRSTQPDELRELLMEAKVVKVPQINMFTKFGFIPSPDGSFYDIGFGQLLGPLSDSVDTTINQLIDAGTLANTQGGFIQEGVSVNGRRGDIIFKRGEFKSVKLPANVSMNNAIYQIKFPEPSLILFQLLGTLIQSAKDISSVQDIMTGGESNQGETATTSVIRVEQGMKVFSSIYKRIFRSSKQEFKKLFNLNSKYLQPEQYFRVLDTQKEEVIRMIDYQGDGTNVQPVADPQLATNMLAMVKNQAVMSTMGHPITNDEEILIRYFNALDIPSPEALIIPPEMRQSPPDPELVLKAQIAASEHSERQVKMIKMWAEALDKVASAESREKGEQLQEYADMLKLIIQGTENATGRTGTMEGGPDNKGNISGIPQIPGSNPGRGD